ncbi:VOC family protein [Pseudomaricurvus hydrocarbonicus]
MLSPDVETSGKFMANVLGWNVSTTEYYTSIYDNDGRLVGGMVDTLAMEWGLKSGGWLMSMQSPDLDVTLALVSENGGKVLLPPRAYPNRGLSALVQDPQGAVFEVLQLSAADDAEPVDDGVWIWHELITTSPQASAAWYAKVFQLEVESMDGGRQLLKKGSLKLATISSNPFEDQRNQWIPVVATGDFETTVGRVSEWGGRVAVILDPPVSSGRLALIQDPTGAAMLLQEQEQE